jgi:hypothetical protein
MMSSVSSSKVFTNIMAISSFNMSGKIDRNGKVMYPRPPTSSGVIMDHRDNRNINYAVGQLNDWPNWVPRPSPSSVHRRVVGVRLVIGMVAFIGILLIFVMLKKKQ